jgi:hypothetical protein
MSLKGIGSGMHGIANQHGEHRKTEPGTDPGIFAGQPVCRPASLQATQEVRFEATRRQEIYEGVTRTICYQKYWKQKRRIKGLLRQYITAMTGLSRAQVTRLIARYKDYGQVQEGSYRRNRFAKHNPAADIELLGTVDEAHGTRSGPATQKILYRGLYEYGDDS